jgi:hypothetical protein
MDINYLIEQQLLLSFKTPEQLAKWMNHSLQYGFRDKYGKIRLDVDNMYPDYRLQSPQQLYQSKTGVCWDQVEFERYFFEKWDIPYKTIYIEQKNTMSSTHTFLIYRQNDNWYWFENSFEKVRGIHGPFKRISEIITKVYSAMLEYDKDHGYVVYEYPKPKYGIDIMTFMKFVTKGNRL